MKNAIIVLSLACAALAATVWFRHQQARQQLALATGESLRFSNRCEEISLKLMEAQATNLFLVTNVARRAEESLSLSNNLTQLQARVARADEDLKAARLDVGKEQERARELEESRDAWADKCYEVKASINADDQRVAELRQRQLASEGDRALLLKELKALQLEHERLTKQFNDPAAMRVRSDYLKKEKVVNRRSAWADSALIRPEYKGGELLTATEDPRSKARLELQNDGSVRLVSDGR